ncbi:MAG: hypothetical protein ACOYEV_04740 [Candidatus Nanopelagicales bacterium]
MSLSARVEITKRYAQAYGRASRKEKGLILDQVVGVTGWNRDHARQQLRRRLAQPKGRAVATVAVLDRRRSKPSKYSYDALKVLQKVWAIAGGICGKYLAAAPAKDPLRGKSTTKPGALLRNSISVRKAGDEVEAEPGFFEVDTTVSLRAHP